MLPYYESAFRQESLSHTNPFRLGRTTLGDFPLHWHSCIEIIYVLDGRVGCRIDSEEYILEKGDVLLINSRDLHSFTYFPDWGNDIILIQIEPSFYSGKGFFQDRKISPAHQFSKRKYFREIDSAYAELKSIFKKIFMEIENEDHLSPLVYSSAFLELLHFYCRLEGDIGLSVQRGESDRLREVIGFIADNYQSEITLADGAEAACLSTFHFSRVFKEFTGQTFTQYLRAYRIKYACHLLLTTELPVTDIAYQCGYSSLKTFYRQFKTVEGVSPGEIRSGTAKSENS